MAIVPDAAPAKSRLATPVLVSPTNNTDFQNYPRDTTLVWQPVTNATGYQVDWQYYEGEVVGWSATTSVTVTGNVAASYTFPFIGDQQGRWRVTALDGTATYLSSQPSAWRTFSYTTALTLPTPKLVSPPADAQFYHYPRVTTLAWDQVLGATGYVVEWQFYEGEVVGWSSSAFVPVSGLVNTSYTFDFIGKQPGRWRVTATGPSSGDDQVNDSAPSAWREFVYHD
jgi:hypothetical protein